MTYPLKHALAAITCGILASASPLAAAPQEMTSAALAKELSSVMTAAGLDAIAVEDPEEPGRFIAAMLIPNVQLLMVTARHSSPDYVTWQIGQKQYRDVYALLQQSGLADSRLFFQDLGVDGLPKPGQDSVDVMYERGAQTLFDGNGENGGGSKGAYNKKLHDADAKYSRLLRLAIAAVRAAGGAASTLP
jgi:phosphomannomutase